MKSATAASPSAGTTKLAIAGAYSGGVSPSDSTVLGAPATAPPVLTSDFNNDGDSDLLWQNSSGQVVIWELSGASSIASGSAGNPGPSWHAVLVWTAPDGIDVPK